MKRINTELMREAAFGVLVIIALILLLNPFGFIMTSELIIMMIMFLSLAIISFCVFVWRERRGDEREQLYRLKSGHASFLIGAGVVTIGIIVQALNHSLDSYLVVTLGAMVLAKLGLSIRNNH